MIVESFQFQAILISDINLFRQPELIVENNFQYQESLIDLLTKRKEEPPSTNIYKEYNNSPRDRLY